MTSPDEVTNKAREESSAVAGTAKDETKAVAGTAKDQASAVASTTAQAATEVKDTAKKQVSAVTSETKQQVGNVVGELREQVSQQSQAQTQRAAGGLRSLADQLAGLAEGRPPQSGPLVDFIRSVADKARQLAGQLESQGPQGMLESGRSFARRRPGGFLATAALAGAAAGRMVKGATAGGSDGGPSGTTYDATTSTTYTGTTPSYDYGTASGMPISGIESDSAYVEPASAMPYADETAYPDEYGDRDPTMTSYDRDQTYRPGQTGSGTGGI